MVTPTDTPADVVERGNHVLSPTGGGVQYDKIWQCELCGVERVHAEDFDDVDCSGENPGPDRTLADETIADQFELAKYSGPAPYVSADPNELLADEGETPGMTIRPGCQCCPGTLCSATEVRDVPNVSRGGYYAFDDCTNEYDADADAYTPTGSGSGGSYAVDGEGGQ